jgi:hypothetical protein
MPSKATPGHVQLSVEIPAALRDGLRDLCSRRRTRLSDEVRDAIARHLQYPPPDAPPLPPLPTGTPKRGGKAK